MDHLNTFFVGIDTHKNQHTAVVISCFHETIKTFVVPNNPQEFPSFLEEIQALDPFKKLVFGLEDTQGLGRSLAQWLLSQGYEVKEVNPSLTRRERNRSTSPDKTDYIDARAIANILLQEWKALPSIQEDATFKAIRQLLNRRNTLVKQRTQLKNSLHHLLHQQYPNYEKFFNDPFGKTALAFWEKFPHPSLLKNYGEKRLTRFLKKIRPSVPGDKAAKILSLIDKGADTNISSKAVITLIPMEVKHLRLLDTQIEEINEKLEEAVEQSSYNNLITIPGAGFVLVATIISFVRNHKRFPNADKLARYAGLVPAESSSGKTRGQSAKKYGCRGLNKALFLLAFQQIGKTKDGIIKNPAAYHYYKKKLSEGKTRKAALRCLQRRLIDIIYAMMRDKTAYYPPKIPSHDYFQKTS